jgi:branched-chain amino acid transport system ATP-binding protein
LIKPYLVFHQKLVKAVFEKIVEINQKTNVAILIVEQKVRDVLEICHKVYSIKLGKVAFSGPPEELKGNKEKLKQLFL